ncbi:hypothetical protein KIN20_008533 [Parelaphostrongylus tenuis]|uniref:Uncharacterized protein n=1 Tax=Parelaphostrongylus tenuis TaxID=148309 RepID=A0AAD5QHI5_PARTN|nr:hypothetical protein KIN20_008533 [Parelaphostrongylus tenuis]
MSNWREEDTLNLTSDVSSIESDKSEEAETSGTTIEQQNSTSAENVLDDIKTPVAPSGPGSANVYVTSERLSLSQPHLPANSTSSLTLSKFTTMSAGNISRCLNKPPHPRVPLVKTIQENKTLKEEMAVLKSKLNVETYKVAELTALLPREVQDILEEFYSLQMSKFDVEEERKQSESAVLRAQKRVDDVETELHDVKLQNQTLLHQCNQYKDRIAELESTIAKIEEFPGSVDSDWTIRTEGDIVADELKARLTAVEKENAALRQKIEDQQKELNDKTVFGDTTTQSKTFVVGGGCDVQALLRRIDELEANLRDEQEEKTKSTTALVAYISRCYELERKINNVSVTNPNLSFSGLSKDEVFKLVGKIRDLLLKLGEENKQLREECARLLGVGDLTERSVESTDVETGNAARDELEKSSLLKENFEQKQQEVFDMLKSLASNVTNLDESVVKILKNIGLNNASDDERLRSEAAFIDAVNQSANMISQPHDTAAYHNLSAVSAPLFELMNRSMNTSKDIINFREKLDTLRGVMQRMFEVLRSSGLLFEEILEKFGSNSDEMKHLADRIRSTKFEWDNVIDESRLFMDIIEETSQSVSKMQREISAWEQSLNETSFRLECSMVHAVTHCSSATQTTPSDTEKANVLASHDNEKMLVLLSTKEEEIVRLQSLVERVREDRDKALSSGDNLRDEVKQLEEALLDVNKERDKLAAYLESNEAEIKSLRTSLEERLLDSEQIRQEVLTMRRNTEALIQENGEKDDAIADLKARLSAAEEMNEKFQHAILERETEAEEIRTALQKEQQGRESDKNEWKTALVAAQNTSSALRHDLERIRNEVIMKEDAIRNLNEQLQTAKENNVRIAEVVSEYASNETQNRLSSKDRRPAAATNVENHPKTSVVKSRDSQTELTLVALLKMESDSVCHSSEVDLLRLAYDELSLAIGKLVVKNIEPVPSPGNLSWIERSCKELTRLIHHERRRREKQASEVAAMTSKLEELTQKSSAGRNADALKEVCPTGNNDVIKQSTHQKVFDNPMRQTLFDLTKMAMDLVKLLRRLSSQHSSEHKVNFVDAIGLAKELRNELNGRLLIVRTEKENENKHCVTDLIQMVRILEKDNHILHDKIKAWKKRI